MRRFVVPEGSLDREDLTLEGDVASHLRDVLRFKSGERIILSDGTGHEAEAELTEVTKKTVTAKRLGEPRALPPPPGLALSLIQCVAKGDKMDQVVRQASELGVREIVPVISERSVAEQRSRVDRWRAIAEDAIRVSGRIYRPRIHEVRSLEEVFSSARAELALCFALEGGSTLQERLARSAGVPSRAEVLIGPEGGLSDAELERADKSGFSVVRLGPHTLRTETAGPAISAILLYWAGAIAG